MPPYSGPPQPYPVPPTGGRPGWFHRLSPGRRVGVLVGGVLMSVLLLCCLGTAIVAAFTDPEQPKATGADRTAGQAAPVAEQPIAVLPSTAEPTSAAPETTAPSPTTASPATASTAAASPTTARPTPPPTPAAPKVTTRTETRTQPIAHGTRTVEDSSLAEGKRVVRTRGVDGVRTLTYRVTLTDGVRTDRTLVSSTVTRKPVTEVIAVGTKQERQCDPNYSGCVPVASDVDCAGGSGNGPAYVSGPIRVIGIDIYRLDSDKDGVACED
ncbi:G5 domain-containing protein [Micromonospora siamensis]|uniref:G5 domain-containing protein n=1 Tax=Micromonospora siamensis TaxID=299152 RepID=A0A1C5HFE7_9ACTN|nr:G5 domain-containing protein [Micromonospora siamensis]SCG44725.1 G5 domain-containing protein [Micromonospora siamensis]